MNFTVRRTPLAARLTAAVILSADARAQLGSFNLETEAPNRMSLVPAARGLNPLQVEAPPSPPPPVNVGSALSEVISRQFSGLLLPIPDNSAVGVVHGPTVSGVSGSIVEVRLQLTVISVGPDPMFNGDIYATLSHASGYVVLLNRVGSVAGSTAGYADNGFSVTLADSAAADVHTYRTGLTGSGLIPISSAEPAAPLTGTWQPDGRTADPATVSADSPRITSLAAFNGLDPNGQWTLFVADLGAGGSARLDSWSLEFTVVPEPGATTVLTGLALVAFALGRRRGRPAPNR